MQKHGARNNSASGDGHIILRQADFIKNYLFPIIPWLSFHISPPLASPGHILKKKTGGGGRKENQEKV